MLRAAIVGLGWWGKHIVGRMGGSDSLRIVAAVDANPKLAAFATENGLAFTTDLTEVLGDSAIDGVILCTPHSRHTEQVLAVAATGKHVFCEKPLALNRADAARSVAACKKAGVQLGIGHERRFEPGIAEVRRLVQSGGLGTIMHAEANFSHDRLAAVAPGDWRTSPADSPAAGMTAMGIHLTDLFIDFFGPIAEVFAATASRVAYPDNGDVVSVHMRFASGFTGHISAILVTPLYIGLRVFGSAAWVELRNHLHPDTPGSSTLTVVRRGGGRETIEYPWTDTVRENLELFARAAAGKGTYPFTDAQKIANIATLEAISRSSTTRLPVAVANV